MIRNFSSSHAGEAAAESARPFSPDEIQRLVQRRLQDPQATQVDDLIHTLLTATEAPDANAIEQALRDLAEGGIDERESAIWQALLSQPNHHPRLADELRVQIMIERSSLGTPGGRQARSQAQSQPPRQAQSPAQSPAQRRPLRHSHRHDPDMIGVEAPPTRREPFSSAEESAWSDELTRSDAPAYRADYEPVLYAPTPEEPVLPPPGPPPNGFGAVPEPLPASGFWHCLTTDEQSAFVQAAERLQMPVDHTVWNEGDRADHLLVILSGWVKVSVGRDGWERVLAVRGPGHIIGEQAALTLRRRSATIVVLDELLCLRMSTARFAAFLSAHPRVLQLLEQQIYERLTENPMPQPQETVIPPAPAPIRRPSAAPEQPSWNGQVCSVVFTDIVDFSGTHRRDTDRLEMRRVMYALLREATEEAGVPWNSMHSEDREDGALLVIRPEFPPKTIIDPMLDRLASGLRSHNRWADQTRHIQLRVAFTLGPVTSDPQGLNGWTIIQAARLLNAATLRDWMARTQADLGFITSDYVYETVIAANDGELSPKRFQPVAEQVKQNRVTGWMHFPSATL